MRKKITKRIQVWKIEKKCFFFLNILIYFNVVTFCFKMKKKIGCFDVYNIETALPVIDMETIENHLKLVKEDERRVSRRKNIE